MTDNFTEKVNEVNGKVNALKGEIEKQNEQIKQLFTSINDEIKAKHLSKEDLRGAAHDVVSELRWWMVGGVVTSALIVAIVCVSAFRAQTSTSSIAPPQVIVVPGYPTGPAGSQQPAPSLGPSQKP